VIVSTLAPPDAGTAPLARNSLWLAVLACRTNFKLIGSPFPCLQVDLTGGEERGYVVLRSPIGPSDTILAPTRRITGIEDPSLQLPDAPDYFEAAWRARALVKGAAGGAPGPDHYALSARIGEMTMKQGQTGMKLDVASYETAMEGEDMRAVVLTLDQGQTVPWHYHSTITDSFVCLKGPMVVETCKLAFATWWLGREREVTDERHNRVGTASMMCSAQYGCTFIEEMQKRHNEWRDGTFVSERQWSFMRRLLRSHTNIIDD
jgi:hypothetical protein